MSYTNVLAREEELSHQYMAAIGQSIVIEPFYGDIKRRGSVSLKFTKFVYSMHFQNE